MFTITFKDSDLVRCRFIHSPLWETQQAVRVMRDPDSRPALTGWIGRAEGRLDQIDLASLDAVMPRRGYQPDFLTVPNASGVWSIADLLAQLRRTDIAVVADELSRCPMPVGRAGAVLESFLEDPAGAREAIADCFEQVWNRLIEPDWPAIEAVLEADIAYRSAQLMAEGLAGVMADVHPTITWDAPVLVVESTFHGHVRPAGQGLVFQPSVFTGPDPIVIVDQPWQPTLVYNARGTATLGLRGTSRAPEALGRLLGTNRAALMDALSIPATTTGLAGRLGLAPSTVSAHLTVLKDAGLLTSRRDGSRVRYRRTPLGEALVN